MRNVRPIVFLAVVTPLVEFLTGSTSAIGVLTDPISAIVFVLLTLPGYILPVLLIREALVVWRKGLASLLPLGIAYGAVNEGLLAKTYFGVIPTSPVLGGGSGVGRWAGVNWPWVTEITLFHMVVSISVPIVLSFLLFPETRSTRFLTDRNVRGFLIVLLVEVFGLLTIEALLSPTFRALVPWMLLPISIIGAGIYFARHLELPAVRRRLEGRWARPVPLLLASMGFFIVTFLPIIPFFPFTPLTFVNQQFYRLGEVAAVLATVYPLVLGVVAIRFFLRYDLSETQVIAVTTGVMILPLATAISIHDLPQGDLAAAAVYIGAIVVAWRRLRGRTGDHPFGPIGERA